MNLLLSCQAEAGVQGRPMQCPSSLPPGFQDLLLLSLGPQAVTLRVKDMPPL